MIVKAYGIEIHNVTGGHYDWTFTCNGKEYRGSLSDMKTQALASACAKQQGKKKRGVK